VPTARPAAGRSAAPGLTLVLRPQRGSRAGGDLQRQAWRWALANRGDGGALPSGLAIALAHGRHERWGRLVKSAGLAGAFGADSTPQPRMGAPMNREDAQVRPAGDPVTKINGRFSGTVITIASAGS
jgi:hypothetical protein